MRVKLIGFVNAAAHHIKPVRIEQNQGFYCELQHTHKAESHTQPFQSMPLEILSHPGHDYSRRVESRVTGHLGCIYLKTFHLSSFFNSTRAARSFRYLTSAGLLSSSLIPLGLLVLLAIVGVGVTKCIAFSPRHCFLLELRADETGMKTLPLNTQNTFGCFINKALSVKMMCHSHCMKADAIPDVNYFCQDDIATMPLVYLHFCIFSPPSTFLFVSN